MKQWKVYAKSEWDEFYVANFRFVAQHAEITDGGQTLIIDGLRLQASESDTFGGLEYEE